MSDAIEIMRASPPEHEPSRFTQVRSPYLQEKMGLNPSELFTSGFGLLAERFINSQYGDISLPTPLEPEKLVVAKPVLGIFAVQGGEVCAQMHIYNAQEPTPVDVDFPDILRVFRIRERNKVMIHFGSLACRESFKSNRRLIGKILREGFNFAKEIAFTRAFACVNPKHVEFYKKIIGFRRLAEVNCVTGLENAPGVLMYATPETVKVNYLLRL